MEYIDAADKFLGNADIKPQIPHSSLDFEMAGLKLMVKEASYPQVWGVQKGGSICSGVRYVNGKLYFGTADGQFYCLSEEGKQIWKFTVGDIIISNPEFSSDSVFFSSFDGNLYCLDLKGNEKWKYDAKSPIANISKVDGDRIYFGTKKGVFHCISTDGELLWKINCNEPISAIPNFDETQVYFGCYDNNLYCLTKDGKTLWKYKADNPVGSAVIGNDKIYANSFDGNFYGLFKSGKLAWKYNVGEPITQVDVATLDGDILYFGAFDECVHAVDVMTGRNIWKYKTGDMIFSAAKIAGNGLYICSTDNHIYSLDKRTGKLIWKYQASGPLLVTELSENKVFASCWDGNLYCLSKGGKFLWKFTASTKPPATVNIQTKIEFNRRVMDAEILNTPLTEIYRSRRNKEERVMHTYGSFGNTYIEAGDKDYIGRKKDGSGRKY